MSTCKHTAALELLHAALQAWQQAAQDAGLRAGLDAQTHAHTAFKLQQAGRQATRKEALEIACEALRLFAVLYMPQRHELPQLVFDRIAEAQGRLVVAQHMQLCSLRTRALPQAAAALARSLYIPAGQ